MMSRICVKGFAPLRKQHEENLFFDGNLVVQVTRVTILVLKLVNSGHLNNIYDKNKVQIRCGFVDFMGVLLQQRGQSPFMLKI